MFLILVCINFTIKYNFKNLTILFFQFTHLEETFKVLNGAYKIITGSKPEGGDGLPADRVVDDREREDSKKTFEEVLEGVSNECAHLENEIRKTSSRPTSKMSTSSRY